MTRQEVMELKWKQASKPLTQVFPPRLQYDMEKLTEEQVLDKFNLDGQKASFYICGNIGTGKTVLSAFMAMKLLKKRFLENFETPTLEFIPVVDLLAEIKASYAPNSSISEMTICRKYMDCDLLILDDFGVEKTTEWSFQMLYMIVNRRYEYMKTTLVTSNYSLNSLGDKMKDARIISRLNAMCNVIVLEGSDFRYK